MACYEDGLPVASNIFEAAAWHKTVKVSCARGHSRIFDPHGLGWKFESNGWSLGFSGARHYFLCLSCKAEGRGRVKAAKIEAVEGVGEVRLPLPPEREWKAALRRFR